MFINTLLISLFTVVELNCENFFDCSHDSLKNDYEFLSTSQRKWDLHRYWNKLTNISREIIAAGISQEERTLSLPDIVILCEVENDSVMTYLTKRSLLRKANYKYIMTNSEDSRGIDVALLYSPMTFRLLNTISFRLPNTVNSSPTRDILYASGEVISGDTIHLYMVHLPSRIGGRKSLEFRKHAAVTLCGSIDSLHNINPTAKILVAGDFNDYEGDSILSFIERESGLLNVTSKAVGTHGAKASYKYMGEWRSIDHILLNRYLNKSFKCCNIEDSDFLLEDDKKYGGKKPRRTYIGYKYNAGYSDHLPVVINLNL
jgi:endonuclease/exonuclease/phosphatase family metal-dependent hydrolase